MLEIPINLSKIHYAKPSITELEIAYATDAACNGWGDECYAYINQFESLFSLHTGSSFAHATSSATGALHLGLAALGIGPGDEVILADTNWIASVAPVVHLGATPVFVDILQDTWCIDPAKVEAAVTPSTKAIIAVHLYGNLCDMDALELIARKNKLYLIEDAAEAIGSRWEKVVAGSRGFFGAFSFHGTKTITTGEGGMLITNNELLYEKVTALNNHGRTKNELRQFWASMVGFKYKMSNVQAAIGCAQMKRIEELISRRREIFFAYHELLRDVSGVTMNPIPHIDNQYGYWMPTIVFDLPVRDVVLAEFKKNNIDGRIFFAPLSSMTMFDSKPENKNSYKISQNALNLPSYHDMTTNDINRVANVIGDAIRRYD